MTAVPRRVGGEQDTVGLRACEQRVPSGEPIVLGVDLEQGQVDRRAFVSSSPLEFGSIRTEP
ncbi:MAG: hypothetical protein ACYSWX_10910 [Planctomycetota bacterium]